MFLGMEDFPGREKLVKYFYPNNNMLGTLVNFLILLSLGVFAYSDVLGLILFLLLLAIKWYITMIPGIEKIYDDCLENDKEYVRRRAVEVMGLVEEEMSLIDPIIGISYAGTDCIKSGIEISGRPSLRSIIKAFIRAVCAIPLKIINFFRRKKKVYKSELVFVEGDDEKVRSSLVSMVIISFTEQQIVSYVCNFDIALGLILEEYTREIFYRDVDSVNYGDETLHIYSAKDERLIKVVVSRFCMHVSSGAGINAAIAEASELLDNQVNAVKNLVRSKKEEMS